VGKANGIYTPNRAELDMNGQILYTLWTYWVYTDDDSLIKKRRETLIEME